MVPGLAHLDPGGEGSRAHIPSCSCRVTSLDRQRPIGLWTAQFNNEAGEDIRYLARDGAQGLPEFDYWMFDSRTVAKMHWSDEDELLGFELVEDPAEVAELNYQRDAAWHRAIPRDEFAAQHLDQGSGPERAASSWP